MTNKFFSNREKTAHSNFVNKKLRKAARSWHTISRIHNYQYMFQWMGRPIIQDPQDICLLQEIIWYVQPDLVVETGVAHGGSLILSASILAAISFGEELNSLPVQKRKVLGIDINIKNANRRLILQHPLGRMIELFQGSSISKSIFDKVEVMVSKFKRVLVILDSNHTEKHVYNELLFYSAFIQRGSAILVMDTGIEYAPQSSFNKKRPWGPGFSPLTAVKKFCSTSMGKTFRIDQSIEKRILITCAPEGLLIKT